MEKLSHHLVFSGEEEDFAYWSEVFEGYMHRKKLRKELRRGVNGRADVRHLGRADTVPGQTIRYDADE